MKPEKIPTRKAASPARRASKPAAKASVAKPTPSKSAKPAKPATLSKVAAKAPAKSKPVAKPVAKPSPKPRALKIPAVLLEGDVPPAPAISGPGQRYALGPTPPAAHGLADSGELPAAYGTQRLLLVARDPHWLYAHWDLTREQLRKYNGLSADGHLVLRVYRDAASGEPEQQVHVHPESAHWFVPVAHSGARYVATIGYYTRAGAWHTISASGATLTPTDTLSEDLAVQFETIPGGISFEQLVQLVRAAVQANVPLAEALTQLRALGHPGLPEPAAFVRAQWTPAQEQALAKVVSIDEVRRVWMGSLEITELIRRQLSRELASQAAAQFSQTSSWSGAITSLSSPPGGGGAARPKGFWFNINAELIIYGATEPDAKVSIGGRKIKLRPDGSFSFRFAFPDGEFELPAIAVSADGEDGRVADLGFRRSTDYSGDVGQHPQDPALKSPTPQNVA